MFYSPKKTNINNKIKTKLLIASIKGFIKNKIKSFKSNQILTTVLASILVLGTIMGSLSMLNFLPATKTANAFPVCPPGYNLSPGTTTCQDRQPIVGLKCWDLSLPNSSNNCGQDTNILFNCASSTASNKVQVIFGGADDAFCTKSTINSGSTNFVRAATCIPRFLDVGNNVLQNQANMDAITNYNPNNITWTQYQTGPNSGTVFGTQTQSAQGYNNAFCKDFTSPCPANYRIIADAGYDNSSTKTDNSYGFSTKYVCILESFANGTLYNSDKVSSIFKVFHDYQLDGNIGPTATNLNPPNLGLPNQGTKCYANGYQYLGRMYENYGSGRLTVCGKSSYQASLKYCNSGYTTDFANSNVNARCYKNVTTADFGCAAGFYLSNPATDSCVACPVLDPLCTAPDNTTSYIRYLYNGAPEAKEITAAQGSIVTTRVYYDNQTGFGVKDAAIKTSLPQGFSYIPGSFSHCKVPTLAELSCDTQPANTKDQMFGVMLATGISPSATSYDGTNNGGVSDGTLPLSPKGLYDIGRKKYLNFNSCHYKNSSNKTFDLLLRPTGNFGSLATDSGDVPVVYACEGGAGGDTIDTGYAQNLKSYPLFNKKTLTVNQCTYLDGNGNSSTFFTDFDPQFKAGTQTSNDLASAAYSTSCTAPIAGFTAYNGLSSSGKFDIRDGRYLNITECVYYNNVNVQRRVNTQQFAGDYATNNFRGRMEYSDTPITSKDECASTGGSNFNYETGLSSFKAIDLLERTRAKGYFEFKMAVPTSGTLPKYTQTPQFTGNTYDFVGNPISPIIVNGTINTNGTAPNVLQVGNIQAGLCNPDPATQGATVDCRFPLTGSTTGFTINTTGFNAFIHNTPIAATATTVPVADITAYSEPCVISGGNTLVCSNMQIPANQAIGNKPIGIISNNDNYYGNKGNINITASTVNNTSPVTVGGGNIGTGICLPDPVAQGSNTNCRFPLTGSNYGYVLAAAGANAILINGVGGPVVTPAEIASSSAACTVFGNELNCNGLVVPATQAVGATQIGVIVQGENYYGQKGSVTIFAPIPGSCTNGAINTQACNQCAPGQYFNSTSCVACPAGSTCAGAATQLVACLGGTYCPTGSTAAIPCSSGYFCGAGAGSATLCTAGNYCLAGSTMPIPCQAGTYCPAGSSSPITCTANSYCPAGVTVLIPCTAGQFSPAGSDEASDCQIPPCTNGATNQSACNACPAGKFFNLTANSCDTCPAGSTCAGNTTQPVACLAGTYCIAGSVTSTPCTGGNFCPVGSVSQNPCSAGNFCGAGAGTQSPCPAGSYCPAGITAPIACTAGNYCIASSPNQTICPNNKYCFAGTVTPTPCAIDAFSPAGSSSASACVVPPCTNGATNQSACNACPAGKFFNLTANSCDTCPAGSTCAGNTTQPVACLAGTYCIAGSVTAITCLSGNYCPMSSGSPKLCTGGNFCAAGASTQSACLASTYCPAGSATPTTCTPGNLCGPGATTQTQCSYGTYCPAGVGVSTNCESGQTSPLGSTSSSACTLCLAGKTCISGTIPTSCPANTYCPAGATAPTNCPTNYTSALGSQNLSSCISDTSPVNPNTQLSNIGTSVATTAKPLSGTVGAKSPIVPLVGNTMPNGTIATLEFAVNGTATLVKGTIQNGSFTPNPGEIIPSDSILGASVAILTAKGFNLTIPTFLTVATASNNVGVPVATISNPITGVVGTGSVPTINLIGNTFSDGTPATFTLPGTNAIVTGIIVGGNFVPTSGQIIPLGVTTGPAVGVLTVGDKIIGVPTNFTDAPNTVYIIGTTTLTSNNPLIGRLGNAAPFIPLSGNNMPNGTVTSFKPAGSTTSIVGTIINRNFIPNANQIIPNNSTTVAAVGVLTALAQNLNIPTNFTCSSPNVSINGVCTVPSNNASIGSSVATVANPLAGTVGNNLPPIPLSGNTMPNGTVASILLEGTTIPITGTIQNGNFIPNVGQVIATNATTGPSTAVLKSEDQNINIPTNISSPSSNTNVGVPSTNPVTGTTGGNFPTIDLVGNTYPDGTPATFTPAGCTVVIIGTIQGGDFVPNSGQKIPNNCTTGPAVGVLKVDNKVIGVVTDFTPAPGTVLTIGTTSITTINPIGGGLGGKAPYIPLVGCNLSNGTTATFKPAGSTTMILGTIINCNFIPNSGQKIPSDSTTGPAKGVLTASGQNLDIPTNFSGTPPNTVDPNPSSGSGGGGSISINANNNFAQSSSSSSSVSSSTSSSSVSSLSSTPAATPKATGVFKSKLTITDPYICGEGSYGNVPNPKKFGVDFVYYDFYKVGSETVSYSFKLKLNDNGDFFLPISKSTNVISEGNYKVVYYATDNDGNKAQGDYTDFITDNCPKKNILPIRTGGVSIIATILAVSLMIFAAYNYRSLKAKKRKLDYDFKIKV